MPRSPAGEAIHYRRRAKELRRLADGIADAESRAALLRIAADYDRLADAAEATIGERDKPR